MNAKNCAITQPVHGDDDSDDDEDGDDSDDEEMPALVPRPVINGDSDSDDDSDDDSYGSEPPPLMEPGPSDSEDDDSLYEVNRNDAESNSDLSSEDEYSIIDFDHYHSAIRPGHDLPLETHSMPKHFHQLTLSQSLTLLHYHATGWKHQGNQPGEELSLRP